MERRFPPTVSGLYRQEYVRVRQSTPRAELPPGLYPDALVPLINPITGQPIEPLSQRRERWGEPLVTSGYDMYALPFEVFEGQNQPIWIDVHVPKDAPAGVYRGVFRVVAREGRGRTSGDADRLGFHAARWPDASEPLRQLSRISPTSSG
jgi:hypothetical protein